MILLNWAYGEGSPLAADCRVATSHRAEGCQHGAHRNCALRWAPSSHLQARASGPGSARLKQRTSPNPLRVFMLLSRAFGLVRGGRFAQLTYVPLPSPLSFAWSPGRRVMTGDPDADPAVRICRPTEEGVRHWPKCRHPQPLCPGRKALLAAPADVWRLPAPPNMSGFGIRIILLARSSGSPTMNGRHSSRVCKVASSANQNRRPGHNTPNHPLRPHRTNPLIPCGAGRGLPRKDR